MPPYILIVQYKIQFCFHILNLWVVPSIFPSFAIDQKNYSEENSKYKRGSCGQNLLCKFFLSGENIIVSLYVNLIYFTLFNFLWPQPKFNEALLEMFRIDYIGAAPYLSCIPSVLHHRMTSGDRFLVLSSDGLYQYFTNDEVVSHVAWFMENVPEGDPAQYLIAELLGRAAKKNGNLLFLSLSLVQIFLSIPRKHHHAVHAPENNDFLEHPS